MAEKRSILSRILKIETGASIPQALLDYIIDKWEVVLAALISEGGMTYLAAATERLNAWGKIAWGMAFWVGVFLFLLMRWLWVSMRVRLALTKYTELSSTHAAVNVLLTTYQKEKIDLWQSFIHFTGRLRKLDLKNAI